MRKAAQAAWLQIIGNWGSTDGDGNAATSMRDTKAVLVGLDMPLGDRGLRAGVAGGYAKGNFSAAARASDAEVKSYHALAYLGGSLGPIQLRLGSGHSWARVQARHSVAFADFSDNLRSSYDARTLQGFAEIGYRVPLGTGWVEPSPELRWSASPPTASPSPGAPRLTRYLARAFKSYPLTFVGLDVGLRNRNLIFALFSRLS